MLVGGWVGGWMIHSSLSLPSSGIGMDGKVSRWVGGWERYPTFSTASSCRALMKTKEPAGPARMPLKRRSLGGWVGRWVGEVPYLLYCFFVQGFDED